MIFIVQYGYIALGSDLHIFPTDSGKKLCSGSVSRTLSQKWGDRYNLADLGAKLDGSASDAETIQSIYAALPSGAVVEIPKSAHWTGAIGSPDPNKHITWLYDGPLPGDYTPPPGDGDTTVTRNNGVMIQSRLLHSGGPAYPFQSFLWQDNPGQSGPFSGNYIQQAAIYGRAIHGPVGGGNVSAAQLTLDSYGNHPASSYDVALSINANKYGQNSMWGIVDDLGDTSAKPPGAFAQWNEYDMTGNGYDILPWDASYGAPQTGGRSAFYVALQALNGNAYTTQTAYAAGNHTQGNVPNNTSVVAITASDGIRYVWKAVTSGTSGTTAPAWPVPNRITATYAEGAATVTVNSVTSGTIKTGDYIIGAQPVYPMKITGQVSGTAGGAGVYSISLASGDASEPSFSSLPVYTAPHVNDGSVVWEFGEEFNVEIGSVLHVSGEGSDTTKVNTLIGGEKIGITNAVMDTSAMTTTGSGVAVRIGDNQMIDLSGNGTPSGRNHHTLFHTPYGGLLAYQIEGNNAFLIPDDFSGFGLNMPLHVSDGSRCPQSMTQGTYFCSNRNASNEQDILVPDHLSVDGLSSSGTLTQIASFGTDYTKFFGKVQLGQASKSDILSATNVPEGTKIYDTDDHVEVTYRCPTPSTCAWFPTQYGTALSN